MIIGLNAELEERISYAYEHDFEHSAGLVLSGIERCVLAKDNWLVPVETEQQDEFSEGEMEASMFIGGRDGLLKKLAETKSDEAVFTAFTSADTLHMIDVEGDPEITVRYPVKKILEDLVASEVCDKLIINPNRKYIVVDKEMAEEILKNAEEKSESAVESDMLVCIEPRAVIDTNELIAEWKKDWQEDAVIEDWRLHSYPVMPDGTILVVYAMEAPVVAGYRGSETANKTTFYRAFHYRIDNGSAELINKYRFKMQDAHVNAVFVRAGKLFAVVRPFWGERYSVLQMFPTDDDAQYKVYRDVNRVALLPDGSLAVAYKHNLHDEEKKPLVVFNETGEIAFTYTDSDALEVTSLNVDSENRIWLHTYPSPVLCMIDDENDEMEHHYVEIPGFNGFGLSDDGSKLVASYSRGEDEMLVYVMRRTESDAYLHPIRFDFDPLDDDGNPILQEDSSVPVGSSFMKSTMLLNAAGRLYVYDLNDCCDETRV